MTQDIVVNGLQMLGFALLYISMYNNTCSLAVESIMIDINFCELYVGVTVHASMRSWNVS